MGQSGGEITHGMQEVYVIRDEGVAPQDAVVNAVDKSLGIVNMHDVQILIPRQLPSHLQFHRPHEMNLKRSQQNIIVTPHPNLVDQSCTAHQSKSCCGAVVTCSSRQKFHLTGSLHHAGLTFGPSMLAWEFNVQLLIQASPLIQRVHESWPNMRLVGNAVKNDQRISRLLCWSIASC